MKKCNACQSEIDEKATICPHCRSKQPIKVGKVAAVISTIIFFVIIYFIFSAIVGSFTGSKTTSQPVTQQMKNDYTAFYKQFMTIANQSDTTNKKVMDDITATSKGTSTLTTAGLYLEASNAKDTQDGLKVDAANLNSQIPDSLSSYHDDLYNANIELFTLISSRSDAMKNMADFLNTNDLSKLKNIQNSTQDQQTAMEQAVVGLLTVGQKLGVDTTKIQVGQ